MSFFQSEWMLYVLLFLTIVLPPALIVRPKGRCGAYAQVALILATGGLWMGLLFSLPPGTLTLPIR